MNDHKSYYNKAVQTCKDNDTTSATWYINFVMAYEKVLNENKHLLDNIEILKDVIKTQKQNKQLKKKIKILQMDSDVLSKLGE